MKKLILVLFLGGLGVSGLCQIMPKPLQVISAGAYIWGGPDITKDRFGNYWFTGRQGIYRYNGKQVQPFRDPLADREDESYLVAAPSADGKLWLKMSNGYSLSYFDHTRQRIVRIPDTAAVVKDYLTKYGTHFLYCDKKGKLWISLKEVGLIHFDPVTYRVEYILNEKINIRKITEDREGNIWLASSGRGVFRYNPFTKEFRNFLHNDSDTETLSDNRAFCVSVRKNGEIMVGLKSEVNIINPQTGKVRRIRLFTQPEYDNITNITQDREGNDYIAHGLLVYRYNDQDGIQRMDLTPTGRFALSFYIDEMNRLWVGNAKYVRVYDLKQVKRTQDLHIVSISLNGTIVKDNNETYSLTRDEKGALALTVQENDNITFNFAPTAVYKTFYSYKIRLEGGADSSWISYNGVNDRVNYQLKGGEYRFRLMIYTESKGWKDAGYVKINVITPVWKRWWAILLYVIAATVIVFLSVREWRKRHKLRKELHRRQQETEVLRRVDEMKTHFFSNLTHEFRTPLTLILNAAEQLENTVPEATAQSRIRSIQQNTQQLLRLINEMLDLTKKDAGKLELVETVGDPVTQLAHIVRTFESMASKKQLSLSFQADNSGQDYFFDQDKIEKIVYNLLSNAIKFTPEGGKVSVHVQISPQDVLLLKVNDTGIGVAPDKLPHIFERFYQADASSTRQYAGTGIGLALVKELVDMMGGTIKAESILHLGSSFAAEIPLRKAAATGTSSEVISFELTPSSPQIVQTEKTASRPPSAAPLVLVIEDNEELRRFLVESLETVYQVKAAPNGQEGIETALEYLPDVVITDVMMPLTDGYEVIQTLKNDERSSHIPIIVLSAKSSFDSKLKGLTFGADEYMSKPFSLSELLIRVKNTITNRQKLLLKIGASTPIEPDPADTFSPVLAEKEQLFLKKIKRIILEHMADESFAIDSLAGKANLSRSQLYRKMQALTNQTPSQFIHQVRLERANELLREGKLNVTQVAYEVGYSSQSYFSKMYQEYFGYSPKKDKV
ncbi:MAG: ATP-binding protein [Spirosomataceae bacterium]